MPRASERWRVYTVCCAPLSRRSIDRASIAFAGLPRIRFSWTTIVSAPKTRALGRRWLTFWALRTARLRANSAGSSDRNCSTDSSMSAGMTENDSPSCRRRRRLRGELEAKTSGLESCIHDALSRWPFYVGRWLNVRRVYSHTLLRP